MNFVLFCLDFLLQYSPNFLKFVETGNRKTKPNVTIAGI